MIFLLKITNIIIYTVENVVFSGAKNAFTIYCFFRGFMFKQPF